MDHRVTNDMPPGVAHKVAVLTTTRPDYGHLYFVLRALERHPAAQLLLYATGTHLDDRRGASIAAIEADGLSLHRTIPIWDASDTPIAIAAGKLPHASVVRF